MTKKVILIILVFIVCISSVIVGIVAPEVTQTVSTIKVTGVSFDKSYLATVLDDNGNPEYDKNGELKKRVELDKDNRSCQIYWTILPADASNTIVSFKSTDDNFVITNVDKNSATLSVKDDVERPLSATITITTLDSNKQDTLDVYFEYKTKSVID